MSNSIDEVKVPFDAVVDLVVTEDNDDLPQVLSDAGSHQIRELSWLVLERAERLADDPYENEDRIKELCFKYMLLKDMARRPERYWSEGHAKEEEDDDSDKDNSSKNKGDGYAVGNGLSSLKSDGSEIGMREALSRIRDRKGK